MNIYLNNGYLDMRKIINIGTPFIFVVGARGIGKTYGSLNVIYDDDLPFILLRRTQTQCDTINIPEMNPFKKLNTDKGINVGTKKISKNNAAFYNRAEIDGKQTCQGSPLGYTGALSTFASVRGFDASNVVILFFDEFIPELHERTIKNEAMAFLNTYESINRNRELEGKPPLIALCAANSNDITNPLFMELGLVKIADKMQKKRQEIYINRERGITIVFPQKSPIAEGKKQTAVAKVTRDNSDYNKMALDNEFLNERAGKIKAKNIKEYRPIVSVGELCIYEHKSNGTYYATTHIAGSAPHYDIGKIEIARFKKHYWWLWDEFIEDNMIFQDYVAETLLTKYFDL